MLRLLLLTTLATVAWACTTPKGQADADSEATPQEETSTMAASEEATDYQVTILNDSLSSPRKEMRATLDGVEVKVLYGSPSVKGRSIWGELVPYGEVWRTGANEATTITFDQDVMIAGKALPAGVYGLFTLPGKESWTLIFNGQPEQWGAYEYKEAEDVLRVEVTPTVGVAMSETLEFAVEGDDLVLLWEKVMVPVPISAS
jgi:hypothetical protein